MIFSQSKSTALFCGALLLSFSSVSYGFDLSVSSLDRAWKKRDKLCKEYLEFGTKKAAVPEEFEVQWRVGRAIYFGGMLCWDKEKGKESTADEKAAYFEYGAVTSEKARNAKPDRVEGHYWYALNFGMQGVTKGHSEALKGTTIVRDELTKAIEIDPKYHFGGPYRVRGRLYATLPGGSISFGDKKKGMEDLLMAKKLGPDYKLNHLFLAELQKTEQGKEAARKTIEEAKKLGDKTKTVGVLEDRATQAYIDYLMQQMK